MGESLKKEGLRNVWKGKNCFAKKVTLQLWVG